MASKIVTTALLAGACALFTSAATAAGEGWETDLNAAMAKAAKEKKSLLIDFTGSDWCGWCVRLNKEVFHTDSFKAYAPKKWILVSLDFPRRTPQSEEVKKQNKVWQKKYKVRGFPSIFLADAKGVPFCKTGYQRGGPKKYIEYLEKQLAGKAKYDAIMALHAKAADKDKLKLRAEALSVLDKDFVTTWHREEVKTILAQDKANKTDFGSKFRKTMAMGEFNGLMRAKKFDEAVKLAAKIIKDYKLTGEDALPLQMVKFNIARMQRKGEQAIKELDKLIAELKPTGQIAQTLLANKGSMLVRINKEEAIGLFKKALEAAPKGKLAPQLKSFLKRLGG